MLGSFHFFLILMMDKKQKGNNDLNRFEALFKYASLGIIIINGSGLIIAVNPFLLQLFGYNESEVRGNTIEMLIPARYRERHVAHRDGYMQQPKGRPMGIGLDLNGIKKDGTEFPVEVSLGKYGAEGENFVIGFLSDISLRKENERQIEVFKNELEATVEKRTAELQNTLHKLEVSNDRLESALSFQKAILDNAGAMLIVTDEKGIIRFFNPEASHITGYSAEEVIDKQTPLLFHNTDDINKKREELFNKTGLVTNNNFDVIINKALQHSSDEIEYWYRKKNGTVFPVSLTVTAIYDKNSVVTGYMGVAIDISERKKAEADLWESLKKEKELGELKSRFVSMASHEFRTPLSTVLSSAYLVEKYITADDQPKREKHIQRIISSVNTLTDILNDFLSVGKIEEGKIQVRLNTFNIQKQVDVVIQEMQANARRDQKILYQHTGEVAVHLDPSLLKHIVMNLVTNAIKFSSEGAVINVETIVSESVIELSVQDHGIGISLEDQEHLMERFYRGANATNIQGTGLGLHIVAKYAELMNGEVSYKSELEKGTTFTVTFQSSKA